MKKIVIFDEYNEIDFKPSDLLHRYVELTERDIGSYFLNGARLVESACPGCRDQATRSGYSRFGLHYRECARCWTLYISPRPDDETLERYYRESPARTFWREELLKMTGKKRKEKIIKPRFEWITDSTEEYHPRARHIADVYTDQYGYIEEMINTERFREKTLLYPFVSMDRTGLEGRVRTITKQEEEKALQESIDVITLFEVVDRVSDVDRLFARIHSLLKKNGLCFMTGILISGFDLQTLWDRAENVFPPDRLNVFSVEGLNALFARNGFECLEFSTPGILDLEIVDKAMESHPEIEPPRFIEYVLRNRRVETRQSFQEFLQENLLSSYGRILLRKSE